MKKVILLLLLVLVSITASARKSYITMTIDDFLNGSTHSSCYIYLSGEVPEDIENKGFEYHTNYHYWRVYYGGGSGMRYNTSEILNWLSENGYEVEFMIDNQHFLLSKEIPSGSQTEIVGDLNSDSEVNVADVNKLVNIILGLAKSNPSIMKQLKEQLK